VAPSLEIGKLPIGVTAVQLTRLEEGAHTGDIRREKEVDKVRASPFDRQRLGGKSGCGAPHARS
jgi:hypothetical protein